MDGKVSVKLYSFIIWQECYPALAWCLCEELWRLQDLNFLSSLNNLENKTLLTSHLYKFTKTKPPLTLVCVAFQKKCPNQNSFTFHDWILTGKRLKDDKTGKLSITADVYKSVNRRAGSVVPEWYAGARLHACPSTAGRDAANLVNYKLFI